MYNYSIYKKTNKDSSLNPGKNNIDQIISIVEKNYGKDKIKSKSEFKKELNKNDFIAIAFCAKNIQGYITGKINVNLKSVHYSGIAILPSASGDGIAKKLIEKTFKEYSPSFISFSTQNPVVYSLLIKNGFDLYPNIKNKVTYRVKIFCQKIIKYKGINNFVEKDFLIKNKYDRCLYDSIPNSRYKDIDSWFIKKIKAKNRRTRNAIFVVGIPIKKDGS